jgi:hypothetical protein
MRMSRKSFLLGLLIVVLVAGVGTGLLMLVRHEPEFYLKNAQPPGKERKQRSGKFIEEFAQFCQDVRDYQKWDARFEEECINSYFDEQFVAEEGLAEKVLPEGITAPRIAIEEDQIRLAFRYRLGPVSTIISIDMRMWLAPKEPNVVALELRGLHAGSLPIAAQSLLEQVSEAARQNNIDVTWYRHRGNPVALLRFQADQDHPTVRLDHLVLHKGLIEIHGRSAESAPLRAMLSFAGVKPAENR